MTVAAGARLASPFLQVSGLTAGYRGRTAIQEISIEVAEGEAVGIIGHNGAGKTTLLKAIFGLIQPSSGQVRFRGRPQAASPRDNIRNGLALVAAERFVFASLTVRDNLQIARRNALAPAVADESEQLSRELFPVVWERLGQTAGSLSGGERRMLSLAMALMWQPSLLLLDEPTVGLAPELAERLFDALKFLTQSRGMSILCVEQSLHHLFRIVDRVYVIRDGLLVGEETAASLRGRADYWDLF
jgi:branched-chain amino acid transport system ATP-binding protein